MERCRLPHELHHPPSLNLRRTVDGLRQRVTYLKLGGTLLPLPWQRTAKQIGARCLPVGSEPSFLYKPSSLEETARKLSTAANN